MPTDRKRHRPGKLMPGEMLFIMVLFHLSEFRNFKCFWLYGAEQKYRSCFTELPSYGRFVSLMPRLFMPFCALPHALRGEETGICIADSTKIAVCHNARIGRHKTFAGLAARGRSSMGWFYGFKLHIVMNHRGKIMAVKITKANTDDRTPLEAMTIGLQGKLLADKGYISRNLFARLWQKGPHLLTGIRKNMRKHLIPILDKLHLEIHSAK